MADNISESPVQAEPTEVVDIQTYTQSLLEEARAAKLEKKDGDTVLEDDGKETEAAEEKEPVAGEDSGEDGADAEPEEEGEEPGREEKPVRGDKLDQIERLLKKEKELVRKDADLTAKYKDAPAWKAKADTWEELVADPIAFLDKNAPQLLERWVEARYGRSGLADKKDAPAAPAQDPRYNELMKRVQASEEEVRNTRDQALVAEYVSTIHSSISKEKANLGLVEDYCEEHGYDLSEQVLEYSQNVATNQKRVVPAAEALAAIKAYVEKEMGIADKLKAKRAKPSEATEEPKKKSKTLSSGLRGSAPKKEERTINNLDDYVADLLEEARKSKG